MTSLLQLKEMEIERDDENQFETNLGQFADSNSKEEAASVDKEAKRELTHQEQEIVKMGKTPSQRSSKKNPRQSTTSARNLSVWGQVFQDIQEASKKASDRHLFKRLGESTLEKKESNGQKSGTA